jgi:serine/threonine protein kinase
MESQIDQPLQVEEAENNLNQFAATASSSSYSQGQPGLRDNQSRPLRFRYPLVSLKRLKTLGPARRVLISNTESDVCLPNSSEQENNVVPKLSSFGEKNHVEASTESPVPAGNLFPEQEKAASSSDQSSSSGRVIGGNYELPEHRKRKSLAEDTSISLTVDMESIGSPSQNVGDLRLGEKGGDYFGTGGFDSGVSFQKLMAQHNLSTNSYSVYSEEVKPYSVHSNIEAAAAPKYELKQQQESHDAFGRSEPLKPVISDGPKRVHFVNLDSSVKGESIELPNSCITDTQNKQLYPACDDQQLQLKSRSLLKHATDGKRAFSSSFSKDDSVHSKPYPSLISEHNKESFVRRGQFVSYDLALGCSDTLKSDCYISDVEVMPNMSSTPLVSVSVEANEKVATDTGVENLSSHLNSLALTENQGSENLSNLRQSFTIHQQNSKQAGLPSAGKDEAYTCKEVYVTKPNLTATATTTMAMDQYLKPRASSSSGNEANNSSILSVPAFSSRTASALVATNPTSVQGMSAPTTLFSVQNHGLCEDPNSVGKRGALQASSGNLKLPDSHSVLGNYSRNLHLDACNSSAPCASVFPSTASTFACQSTASIRCTSGPLASLSLDQGLYMSSGQIASTKENSGRRLMEEPSNARLQEPQVETKSAEERVSQEPRVEAKSVEEIISQEPHVVSKANEERCQDPEVASRLDKLVQVSSSQSNFEKAGTGRETSTSRKKHYDPDAFFRVNNKIYQKLGKIGSGGSSEVHKVISSDCTIYALKKINLKGRDYSTAYGFCQEMDYLTRLRGKNYIIQLIDYEITNKSLFRGVMTGDSKFKDGKINEDAYIYMVLEYGEIDLAQMLLQKRKEMDAGRKQIDENWLRFYWQQVLKAVNTIHEERIVHSDLKPANFLLVKGVLKLIDFGIAKAIQSDTTNIQRDSQVGTLNYMSPEAFMCNDQDENGKIIKCGRPSDIWSLGCILYQMVYGKTPFADFTTFWSKYKEITNKDHKIMYGPVSNPWLLDIMKKCLAWNRNERLRIPQLLEHPFLQPPVSPLSLTQEEWHCKTLSEISKAYGSEDEIQSLCEKLQEHIRNLSKHTTGEQTGIDKG